MEKWGEVHGSKPEISGVWHRVWGRWASYHQEQEDGDFVFGCAGGRMMRYP